MRCGIVVLGILGRSMRSTDEGADVQIEEQTDSGMCVVTHRVSEDARSTYVAVHVGSRRYREQDCTHVTTIASALP